MHELNEPQFIDTREASRISGIPVATLVTWRSRKTDGPPFYTPKGTRRILYERNELIDWVIGNGQRRSTADRVINGDSGNSIKCNDPQCTEEGGMGGSTW